MTRSFEGSRALITGGSSGIGLAVARELARRGAHVALAARDVARLDAAVREVRAVAAPGVEVRAWSVDVTDAVAVAKLRADVLAEFGELDVLVLSAGATHPAAFHDTSLDTFRALMDVNYFGTVHVTRAFVDDFRRRRKGHVVGISSVAGLLGVYGYAAYTSSKFAVAGFFECLRQELRVDGIDVSVVFPGDTDTPMLEAENRIKPDATRAVAGNVPAVSADEVARAIVLGMQAKKFRIVPGVHAKVVALLARYVPELVRAVTDRQVRRAVTR